MTAGVRRSDLTRPAPQSAIPWRAECKDCAWQGTRGGPKSSALRLARQHTAVRPRHTVELLATVRQWVYGADTAEGRVRAVR